jgi:hypothetical protein
MTTIHKYELLPIPGYQRLEIRQSAKLLKIGAQGKKIVLWYEVDVREDWEWVYFLLLMTGQPFGLQGEYKETIQIDDYVLHIYQLEKEENKEKAKSI